MPTTYQVYKGDEDQFELRQLSGLSPTSKDTKSVLRGNRKELLVWLGARTSLWTPESNETRAENILAELDEGVPVKFVVP